MSQEPESQRPSEKRGEIEEATISFDAIPDLPETTMAFETGCTGMPDATHYPSVVHYVPREEVGRGGMAKIFSAADSQLKRLVAIKVSTADVTLPDTLFQTEAEVLAGLAHPNIPPIHSRGVDDMGRAFYSMKLIEGQTLQKIIKQLAAGDPETAANFTLPRLLEVFRKVCDGVAFAHAKGYLHRDLKPENIMVGEFGEVLVMDWGLALPLESRAGAARLPESLPREAESGTIRLQGTPQYMSPEQVEGMVEGLDERSDVYALGGVLYAILTLQSPVSGSTLQEVLERVRNGEITPIPSTRTVSGVSVKTEKTIPEALQAVAFKAMARRRSDRYGDVNALVADIEAYQNGFATSAEQAGFLRQLTLLVKRNRAASVLMAVLVLTAAVFTVRLAQSEKLSRLRALEAQQNAAAAVAEQKAARRSAAEAQMTVAEFSERENNFSDLRRALQAVPEELRDQRWGYLEDRFNGDAITIPSRSDAPWYVVKTVVKKPGMLVALEKDGSVLSVDLNSGSITEILKFDPAGISQMLAVSGDGGTVAVIRTLPKAKNAPPNAPQSSVIEVYGVDARRLKYSTPTLHLSDQIIFSDSGQFFGVSSYAAGGDFSVCDASNGRRLWEKQGLSYFIPWFSEQGDTVHLLSAKNSYFHWDALTGQEKAPKGEAFYPSYLPGSPRTIAVSSSGTEAFLPSKEGFDLVDTKTGKLKYNHQLPLGYGALKCIDADWKNQFLFCGFRKTEREALLEVLSGRDGRVLMSTGFVTPDSVRDLQVLFHPQSKHLVAVSGKYLKAWSLQPATGFKRFEIGPRSPHVISQSFCFLEDSNHALAYLAKDQGRFLTLLNLTPDGEEGIPFEAAGLVNHNFGATVSASADGRTVFIANMGQNNKQGIQVCRTADGTLKPVVRKEVVVTRGQLQMIPLQVSPSGAHALHGHVFRDAQTFSQTMMDATGYLVLEEPGSNCWLGEDLTVRLAVPARSDSGETEDSPDRVLFICSKAGGKPLSVVNAPRAVAVSASPEASQIAEAGKDLRVRIRDAKTLQTVREIRAHEAPLTAVAWHPRLPLLATAAEDHRVKIWDLRTDRVVHKTGLFLGVPSGLYWSPDGKTLAVQHNEGGTFISLFKVDCCNE